MTADIELPPIEHDEGMDRTYIPLPGGWEVQTKGKGSTFRICEPGDNQMRLAVPASPYLHDTLARMARDIHAAVSQATAAKDAETEALRAEVSGLRAARIGYASEFPPTEDGDPDVGNIHANIRAMKSRAEQLAEALRRQRDWWLASKGEAVSNAPGGLTRIDPGFIALCDAHVQQIDLALRDHDQEGKDG